jgi:hypothetical protein
MGPQLLAWAGAAMDVFEVIALSGVLWQFFHLNRNITAMLRILRRIDRKIMAEPLDRGGSPTF